jgi:hypothetical protein
MSGTTVGGSADNANGSGAQSDEVPISNICFLKNTKIKTDQGYFNIQDLKPGHHTIDDLELLCITQTITDEAFLIKIKKNAFKENKPSQDLILSQNHCIQNESGRWVAAKDLKNVEKYPYNKEILYNIVLERTHQVSVYNLTCETLPPDCKVAKYFLQRRILKNDANFKKR